MSKRVFRMRTVEDFVIRQNKEFYDFVNTNGKLGDFLPGDIVKCTYLKGIFRVAEVFKNTIEIYPVDSTTEFFEVDPTFLKKMEINKDSIKILYGEKLT